MVHDIHEIKGEPAMAYVKRGRKDIPWHTLGTPLPEDATIEEALEISHIGERVEKRPVYTAAPPRPFETAGGEQIRLDRERAIVRVLDNRVFAVASDQYEIVQVADAVRPFSGLPFETAGLLGNGSRYWLLARTSDQIKVADGDYLDPYVLVTGGHDARHPVRLMDATTRVVCANTLAVALRHGGSGLSIKIRHTSNAHDRLAVAEAQIAALRARQLTVAECLRQFGETMAHDKMISDVAEILFPVGEALTDRQEENRKAQRLRFWTALNSSPTVDNSNAYGVFNAVTEYLDWGQTRNGQNPTSKNADWRERRALFSLEGAAATQRSAVFKALSDHAGIDLATMIASDHHLQGVSR